MKPFLKWAGGKRKLLSVIVPKIQEKLEIESFFFEPFVGAGAVFLELNHNKVIFSDLNKDLINAYHIIKNDYNELIKLLEIHQKNHNKEYYYKIRELDRDEETFNKLDPIIKAARLIYLNKTCYNGLYRVNSKGEFNTPWGYYANPKIFDKENLKEISNYFNQQDVRFYSEDFSFVVEKAKSNDFVYFDPPYDYDIKGFSKYQKDGFTKFDLNRLKEVSDQLIQNGVNVLISNHATNNVLSLFSDEKYQIIDISYEIEHFEVSRTIGSNHSSRIKAKEVLIYGKRKEDPLSSD